MKKDAEEQRLKVKAETEEKLSRQLTKAVEKLNNKRQSKLQAKKNQELSCKSLILTDDEDNQSKLEPNKSPSKLG